MSLVVLIPFAVISTMLYNAGVGGGLGGAFADTVNGRSSRGEREMEGLSGGVVNAAGSRMEGRQGRRRLQATTSATTSTANSIAFATQLEMTVCLTTDHTSDSAQSTAEQVTQASDIVACCDYRVY